MQCGDGVAGVRSGRRLARALGCAHVGRQRRRALEGELTRRRRGAQLRKVELARPRSVIAKNTVEALQSGMVFGAAAQVEGIVHRMVAELGVRTDDMTVVATGHLAPLVLEECSVFTVHDPWLTLRGLGLVFDRNR